jgi:hydroxyacylglutathione hydrolase
LIDAGAGFGSRFIRANILEAVLEPNKVKYVVLTHSHWDHAQGSKSLRELLGCMIAIHERGADALQKGILPGPYGLKHTPVKVDLNLSDGDVVRVKVRK